MIASKAKKWGNSIGVILPKELVEEKGIKPEDDIFIEVEKKGNALKELAGALRFKKPTEELLEESRKEMKSKFGL